MAAFTLTFAWAARRFACVTSTNIGCPVVVRRLVSFDARSLARERQELVTLGRMYDVCRAQPLSIAPWLQRQVSRLCASCFAALLCTLKCMQFHAALFLLATASYCTCHGAPAGRARLTCIATPAPARAACVRLHAATAGGHACVHTGER